MNQTDDKHASSAVLITLFKGILYQDQHTDLWQTLMLLQTQIKDQVALFGLELMLDEAEGYAYLRQKDPEEGKPELPRLVQRRQLSYPVSLLLALIRRKLQEHDATSGDARLILSRDQIIDLIRHLMHDSTNEARLIDRVNADIKRIVDLGFLRPLRNQPNQYEVRRILKAFVDAQWLSDFEQRLADYREFQEENNG